MNSQKVPGIILALLLAGGGLWFFTRSTPESNALRIRALATRTLAGHLAQKFPGQRVLVLSNPFTLRAELSPDIKAMEQAGVRGLQKGFGAQLKPADVVFPELLAEAKSNPRSVSVDPESPTPLSYLVAEDAFDKLAGAHPDAGVFVSLIGVPVELDRVQCWRTNAPPAFGLLLPDLRLIGNAAAVRAAMQRGKLAAFVLSKPSAPPVDQPLSGNLAAEFEKRFLLVTPENLEQQMQAHPALFPAP